MSAPSDVMGRIRGGQSGSVYEHRGRMQRRCSGDITSRPGRSWVCMGAPRVR